MYRYIKQEANTVDIMPEVHKLREQRIQLGGNKEMKIAAKYKEARNEYVKIRKEEERNFEKDVKM